VFADGAARTVTYDVTAPSLGLLSIDMTGFGATATLSMPPGINFLTTNGIIVGGYSGSGSGNATSGSGALIQSGGTITTNPTVGDLILGYGAGSTGAYALNGGALVNNLNEYVGLFGTGTFNHSAGSNTINGSAAGIFSVGHNANSTGTYNLSGTGTMSVSAHEYIGYGGTGNFIQSSGSNSITNNKSLYLGYQAGSTGVYTLNGGALVVSVSEFVGYAGSGTFNHSGGSNRFLTNGGSFEVGALAGSTGIYNLSGTGSLMAGRNEYIGNSGTGTFNQTGGTNSIVGSSTSSNLLVGFTPGGVGTYNLSAGTLSTGDTTGFGDQYVGHGGTGYFNQSGGTNTIRASLFLGRNAGSTGVYTLTGGALAADVSEYVGYIGSGSFTQSAGTNSTSASLYVGYNSGSSGTYTLTGGAAVVAGHVIVGGNELGSAGGTGVLSVSNIGVLTVIGTLKVHNTSGTGVNLSTGGRINTAALDFGGVPSRLNWTGGTLNLTSNVVFDAAAATTSTGAAFGAAATLGSNRTLMITGNETLGGVGSFGLTLNSGSTHLVTGTLIISPTGTITQNPGSTLYAPTIIQAGGTVNGTLQNQANFFYQSGQFNGRLLNQGMIFLGPSFTAGNGVENDAMITLAAGQTLTVNGAGLDNLGTFLLAGGVISGGGPVVNNYGGTLQGYGTVNPAFTNNGVLHVDGVLRLNAGANTNSGIVQGSGTVIGAFTNAAGGTLDLMAGDLFAISNTWANSGLVRLAANAVLGGGNITNTGTIQGAGTINSQISNSGVIRASGGELDLGRAGNTNASPGLIQASTGNTVMVLQGLATNAGTIALTGGAFDNNNRALTNSGIINGYGTIRTSALTNTNKFNVGEGNMDVFGSVTNNGTIGIQGGRSIYFFGNVSGSGGYTGTGTAVFLAAVSPGSSPAAVSFGGSVTLAASSALNIELGGTTRGSEFDAIHVNDTLSLGGTLVVSLIDAGAGLFAPSAGQAFNILDWGSRTGTFSAIQLPTLAGGLVWKTDQLYTIGVLAVAPGLLGDFNHDNTVDAADYVMWQKTQSAGSYNDWRNNFGNTSGSGGRTEPFDSTVPEPATLALILLATFASCARPRRRG
jgi:hypothetical protein